MGCDCGHDLFFFFKQKTAYELRISDWSSDVCSSDLRLCRDVWGLKIADLYSTQEAGYLALQCPEHEHYHVQSEAVLLEVLDEEDRPCRPGEVGRVVVTPLTNFAMPMIRYRSEEHTSELQSLMRISYAVL